MLCYIIIKKPLIFFFRKINKNILKNFIYLNHTLILIYLKKTRRNNSYLFILLKQSLKDVEKLYRENARLYMNYDEFKTLYREVWKDEFTIIYIDKSKKVEG